MTLHGGICKALVFERHCLNLCEHILLDNLRSSKFARVCSKISDEQNLSPQGVYVYANSSPILRKHKIGCKSTSSDTFSTLQTV